MAPKSCAGNGDTEADRMDLSDKELMATLDGLMEEIEMK